MGVLYCSGQVNWKIFYCTVIIVLGELAATREPMREGKFRRALRSPVAGLMQNICKTKASRGDYVLRDFNRVRDYECFFADPRQMGVVLCRCSMNVQVLLFNYRFYTFRADRLRL